MTQENEIQQSQYKLNHNNIRYKKRSFKDELRLEIESLFDTIKMLIATIIIAIVISTTIFAIKIMNHENYELARDISYITDIRYGFHLMIMINSLEKIPEKQLKQINESGYELVISKNLLNEKYKEYQDNLKLDSEHISGLTIHREKLVCIRPNLNSISITTLHEAGHIIDKLNGYVSNTEGFKEVYEKERENTREYSKDNISEYFADIYSLEVGGFNMTTLSRSKFPITIKYLKSQDWW